MNRKSIRFLVILSGIFLSNFADAAPQKVAILGDSITYAGQWAARVESALLQTPKYA